MRPAGDLSLDLAQQQFAVPGVEAVAHHNNSLLLTLTEGASPQGVLRELLSRDVLLEKFEIAVPTLDEIFIQVVEEDK